MFGIKIREKFIDLGQRKFNLVLKSPFYWNNSDQDVIQGSILLSSKVPLTPRNVAILGKPHLLTNPNLFLKNENAEIWSNGSLLFTGKAEITEATEKDISLSVQVNNLAHMKNLLLKNINYGVITGNPREKCVESVYFPDMHPFSCPTILTPYQWGEASFGGNAPWVNLWGESDNRFGTYDEDFQLSDGGTYAPFPKIAALLRGIFREFNMGVNNPFENSEELKRLILYYNNPMKDRTQNSLSSRYNDIDLSRHVPQNLSVTNFLKYYTRFFNQGIILDNLNGSIHFLQANDLLDNAETLDWTKKVAKSYRKTTDVTNTLKFFREDKTPLYDVSALATFNFFPDSYNETPTGIYTGPDGEPYYIESIYTPPPPPPYEFDPNTVPGVHTHILSHSVTTGQTEGDSIELKVHSLPSTRNNAGYFNTLSIIPISNDKNAIAGADEEKINLLLYRGKNNYPLASTESQFIHEYNGKAIAPIKLGNQPTGTDNRNNAQFSLSLTGQNGIFNTFWKKWAAFLSQKREIEFDLVLNAKDLRNFTFSKNIYLGNQLYIVKELSIQFEDKGISGAKGVFAQL